MSKLPYKRKKNLDMVFPGISKIKQLLIRLDNILKDVQTDKKFPTK